MRPAERKPSDPDGRVLADAGGIGVDGDAGGRRFAAGGRAADFFRGHLSVGAATTYAEALYQAAADKDAVGQVAADLSVLAEVLGVDSDVARVLHNPKVDSRAKKAALGALADTAHPLTVNLLQVMVDRGRLEELPSLASAFAERVASAEGRLAVEVTSAIPLVDDLRAKVVARVRQQTGKTPEITERVDPDIIGGLVLRVGGVVTDASVRGRLDGLRRSISDAS